VAEATRHDLEAIARNPAWVELTYEPNGPNTHWYESSSETDDPSVPCVGNALAGTQCDEFPFWASQQGGPLARPLPHLKLINADDNQREGGKYGNFASVCHMSDRLSSPEFGNGDLLVLPSDPALAVPTLRMCNGNP
jgi:hypothetical protein